MVVEKVAKLLGRLFGVPVVSMISARPVEAIMFLVACLFVCSFAILLENVYSCRLLYFQDRWATNGSGIIQAQIGPKSTTLNQTI